MAKKQLPRKQSKHFEFTIPTHETARVNGQLVTTKIAELLICGVGYKFPNEEPDEMYDFDIDEVFYIENGIHTQIPIAVVAACGGTNSINELDHIYNPVAAHMEYLFSPEYDKEKAAQDFDNLHHFFGDVKGQLDGLTIRKTD